MKTKMMALALLTLAGTAMAQPGTYTDLGNHTTAASFTQNVTSLGGADIQWFRIVLPAVSSAAGWVDVWTTPTGDTSTDMTDTEIGMFDDAGNGASTVWNDDDGGPGLYSQLSYGSTTSRGATTYPGQTNGGLRNGNGGALAGGVYWVAVGRYNVNWTTGFGANGTSTSTQTTTTLNFDISPATAPYPPTATGAATPSTVQPTETVVYTVTVVPGGNPASTGITVHGDLSAVGGSGNALFHDDGNNGDAAAGDGIYSFQYTIPAGTAGGVYSIPVTVADAQSRSGTATISSSVFNPLDLGTLVDGTVTSTDVPLAATEIKWYRATIADCSVAAHRNLIVTTSNSTSGGDSEIGVYDSAGTLVANDDDSGVNAYSLLSFGFQGVNGDIGAGQIFIAVGTFNTTFTSPFGAVSTGPAGDFQLELLQTSSFPATATGAVTNVDLSNILMTVTVTPGTNPDSTGIAVSADLSSIGGSSTQAFFDDGTHGDATAGDHVYSYNFTTSASTPVGQFSTTATVTDDQGDNLSVTLNGSVVAAPDSVTDLGQIGAGAGGSEVVTTHDTDIQPGAVTWLKFSVGTDVVNDGSGMYFDIDTEPSGDDGAPTIGSINDTELGLYNAGGTFLVTDDDDGSNWHSELTFGDSSAPRGPYGNGVAADGRDGALNAGEYYLAAGCYNSVFNNFFGATSTSTASGTIQVNFRTNIPGGGGPAQCSVADVGIAGGLAGHDHLLDNNDFISFITLFFSNDPQADMGMAGGLPGSDNLWDNNDFIAFIGHFFDDAAHCNG